MESLGMTQQEEMNMTVLLDLWKACLLESTYTYVFNTQEMDVLAQEMSHYVIGYVVKERIAALGTLMGQMPNRFSYRLEDVRDQYRVVVAEWEQFTSFYTIYKEGKHIARYYTVLAGMRCIQILTDLLTEERQFVYPMLCDFYLTTSRCIVQ